ncbi:hypothetical protein GO730_12915 [Spirosoma sp. HMF3257]|uniref:Cytochrome B n=1 Tax=Spirosoma telluris TaxID=2183553 RepID=A0A327NIB1_9BACT|nr:hypothetical protein [Spirosoma telluris]RAI74897.1 hypothetical protein HMF3257_12830 [Spirosoma telluris]
MYSFLLVAHSLFRWLVLLSLIYAIGRAYQGYTSGRVFTKTDNSVRHWTATIAHLQLVIGFTLYFSSPLIKYFWANVKGEINHIDTSFFGLIHILLMLIAIVILTIGSALAKRRLTDVEKFRTMLIWFSIALFIIFIAIPWPFSPLANRPYFR